MTITRRSTGRAAARQAHAPLTLGITVATLLTLTGASEGRRERFCSETARAQLVACQHEVKDDRLTLKAVCINTTDEAERDACFEELEEARADGNDECRAQHEARRALCDAIGESRYDPSFDPADFDTDLAGLTTPNPYFPLAVGHRWEYAGGDETTVIEVQDKTKLIAGVTCFVVNDLVQEGGVPKEDTDDWFAHAKDGAIHYCGESVRDFETFAGDDPNEPELVEIEGSFKAGRDGDKPGILFPGTPIVGATFRQEWSPGNAEDAATVLSTTYGFGGDPALDVLVPQDLADHLCAGDCVVIGELSPLEPDAFEHKYFAPGVGKFLEVDRASGDVTRLVACNVHAKCATLPAP